MKVAAVQTGLYLKNPGKAVDEAERQVREAAKTGARLVCLAEHWMGREVLTEDGPLIARFGGLASELGVYLNLGANYFRLGKTTRLRSHTFSPSGRVIARQDKVHLYRDEAKTASPGTDFTLVKVDKFQVGVLVCHDAVFPETARIYALMGADLLVIPAMIVAKGGDPWVAYLRARALENRIPIVSTNTYYPPPFLGLTMILDLKYDKRAHIMQLAERRARREKTVLAADFDLTVVKKPREERLGELFRSKVLDRLESVSRPHRSPD
jgi:predicted amidohydrolase